MESRANTNELSWELVKTLQMQILELSESDELIDVLKVFDCQYFSCQADYDSDEENEEKHAYDIQKGKILSALAHSRKLHSNIKDEKLKRVLNTWLELLSYTENNDLIVYQEMMKMQALESLYKLNLFQKESIHLLWESPLQYSWNLLYGIESAISYFETHSNNEMVATLFPLFCHYPEKCHLIMEVFKHANDTFRLPFEYCIQKFLKLSANEFQERLNRLSIIRFSPLSISLANIIFDILLLPLESEEKYVSETTITENFNFSVNTADLRQHLTSMNNFTGLESLKRLSELDTIQTTLNIDDLFNLAWLTVHHDQYNLAEKMFGPERKKYLQYLCENESVTKAEFIAVFMLKPEDIAYFTKLPLFNYATLFKAFGGGTSWAMNLATFKVLIPMIEARQTDKIIEVSRAFYWLGGFGMLTPERIQTIVDNADAISLLTGIKLDAEYTALEGQLKPIAEKIYAAVIPIVMQNQQALSATAVSTNFEDSEYYKSFDGTALSITEDGCLRITYSELPTPLSIHPHTFWNQSVEEDNELIATPEPVSPIGSFFK